MTILTISSFDGDDRVETMAQLHQAIARRHASLDANHFLLVPEHAEFPQLAILARGNVAVLHYMTADRNFISRGRTTAEPRTPTIFFETGAGAPLEMPAEAVVDEADAVAAAVAFFASGSMPGAIAWLEI